MSNLHCMGTLNASSLKVGDTIKIWGHFVQTVIAVQQVDALTVHVETERYIVDYPSTSPIKLYRQKLSTEI